MTPTCLSTFSKAARFQDLTQAVSHCTLCPRLCSRTKVLSDANGSLDSKVLLVAEAPGRLGADRTGIPLAGDRTGDNFEALLGNVGWRREMIFATNAVLCNPRQENGNNGTPTQQEITNCVPYLEMTISLLQPEVVVAMGAVALKALDMIHPHGMALHSSVGQPISWANRVLVPLYHPGPRALIHRALANQRADFIRLAKYVDPVRGILKKKKASFSSPQAAFTTASVFDQLIYQIVQSVGRMTYFKLTKLLYLVDCYATETLGQTISGQVYLRVENGPWPPELRKSVARLNGHEVRSFFVRQMPFVEPGPSPRFEITLDDKALDIVASVLERYGGCTNAEIKTVAYRTKPMKHILAEERNGKDMRRISVLANTKPPTVL